MTTTELIEKYGIGPTCLNDAYALGMMHGLDVLEHAIEFAEEKAIADAIEEYKKKIEFEYKWLLDCKVFEPNVDIAFNTLISYAEQLKAEAGGKEKNNDR